MGQSQGAHMRRRRGVSIHRFVGVIFLWMQVLFYKTSGSASLDASSMFAGYVSDRWIVAFWNDTFKMVVPGSFSNTPTGERSVGIGNMPSTTTLKKIRVFLRGLCRFSCALICYPGFALLAYPGSSVKRTG